MSFRDILQNTTADDIASERLIEQAKRRQAYNRAYQAKIREKGKLLTLERKIDENINHVIKYLKTKYGDKLDEYIPSEPVRVHPAFAGWWMLSANVYKTKKHAFEVSTLEKSMTFDEFSKLFDECYKLGNDNKYYKVTSV